MYFSLRRSIALVVFFGLLAFHAAARPFSIKFVPLTGRVVNTFAGFKNVPSAAGVIPYAIGRTGEVYFLLGYNSCPGRHFYEGFGGTFDEKEDKSTGDDLHWLYLKCAVREAQEESMSLLGQFAARSLRDDGSFVVNASSNYRQQKRDHAKKIELRLALAGELQVIADQPESFSRFYTLQIPKFKVDYFAQVQTELSCDLARDEKEITQVRWVSLPNIRAAYDRINWGDGKKGSNKEAVSAQGVDVSRTESIMVTRRTLWTLRNCAGLKHNFDAVTPVAVTPVAVTPVAVTPVAGAAAGFGGAGFPAGPVAGAAAGFGDAGFPAGPVAGAGAATGVPADVSLTADLRVGPLSHPARNGNTYYFGWVYDPEHRDSVWASSKNTDVPTKVSLRYVHPMIHGKLLPAGLYYWKGSRSVKPAAHRPVEEWRYDPGTETYRLGRDIWDPTRRGTGPGGKHHVHPSATIADSLR